MLLPLTMPHDRIAGFIAYHVTHAIAWVVSAFRPIYQEEMSYANCDALGVPWGNTEPAVYVTQTLGESRRRLSLRSDGEGCITLHLLGWTGEIQLAQDAAGAVSVNLVYAEDEPLPVDEEVPAQAASMSDLMWSREAFLAFMDKKHGAGNW